MGLRVKYFVHRNPGIYVFGAQSGYHLVPVVSVVFLPIVRKSEPESSEKTSSRTARLLGLDVSVHFLLFFFLSSFSGNPLVSSAHAFLSYNDMFQLLSKASIFLFFGRISCPVFRDREK